MPECKEHVHRSFIKWLHAKGEEGAARWFENQWEGKSWMLCDIGYSMAGGNNGQEGSHRYKRGATGGGRKNLNLPYSLALLAQFMEDHSERLEARAIAHGIKHTSFQRTPELTCHHWDLLQRLDQRTLLLTYCPSKSAAYTALMGDIETRLRRDDNLYDIINRCSLRRLVASKDCIRVCVPSQALLRKVDPEKSMSLPELRTRVWELGQAYFEGAADGFRLCKSIEETLDLYEDFYILEALNKPWGPGAHFKCTCEDCFRDCTCHHSLMMSLLCKDDAKPDEEAVPLSMPAEYRTRGVPTRRRKRGRPTARAASTLGDRKAMDQASDEEEQIEPKVSSVP